MEDLEIICLQEYINTLIISIKFISTILTNKIMYTLSLKDRPYEKVWKVNTLLQVKSNTTLKTIIKQVSDYERFTKHSEYPSLNSCNNQQR